MFKKQLLEYFWNNESTDQMNEVVKLLSLQDEEIEERYKVKNNYI